MKLGGALDHTEMLLRAETGLAHAVYYLPIRTKHRSCHLIGWPIDSKEIALTISEPGALTKQIALAVSDLGDAVDRPQARKVVFLEHHSTPSQPLHGRLDVFDLPRHLSVISCAGAGRLEERKLPLTTAVEQTSGPLFARFETQLLCVERPGPLQILYRDPRRDLAVFNHSHRPPSIGLP